MPLLICVPAGQAVQPEVTLQLLHVEQLLQLVTLPPADHVLPDTQGVQTPLFKAFPALQLEQEVPPPQPLAHPEQLEQVVEVPPDDHWPEPQETQLPLLNLVPDGHEVHPREVLQLPALHPDAVQLVHVELLLPLVDHSPEPQGTQLPLTNLLPARHEVHPRLTLQVPPLHPEQLEHVVLVPPVTMCYR